MTVGEQHRTLREVVADEIRSMIVRGELGPGERLFEDRLAEQLGVSRNPVREAIRSLEVSGLVEVLPRRGAYVARADDDRVRHLLELRRVVLGFAAEQAAQHRTAADVAAMQSAIDLGRAAAAADDIDRATAHHGDFHRAVERAAGNSYLRRVTELLRDQSDMMSSAARRFGISQWDEHQGIADAIAAGDPVAAAERMRAHVDDALRAALRSRAVTPGRA